MGVAVSEHDLAEAPPAIFDKNLSSLVNGILQVFLHADALSNHFCHGRAPLRGELSDHRYVLRGEIDAELHDRSGHTSSIQQEAG
jgi:hypothetical protein